MSVINLKDFPEEDRPRERLLSQGADALSSAELIAILLGSGTKGKHVLDLAQEIISHFGSLEALADATVPELCEIHGLGNAKAIQLKAALGLAKRMKERVGREVVQINHPEQVYRMVCGDLEDEKREVFLSILLDVKGCVIGKEVISIGTLSNSLVHPREVFYPAIRNKAASMILVHNHPSGDPTPSREDLEVTDRLMESGKLIGIPVEDHIVIGKGRYRSIRQMRLQKRRVL